MKEKKDVEQLFYHELKVLWSSEKMLTKSIPVMIEKASHPALKMSLAYHLAETDQHKVALEMICKQLDVSLDPERGLNPEMKSILEEGEKLMNKNDPDEAMDSILIANAQKAEHYEISAYGSAAFNAEMLGFKAIASRLRLTLEEEQQADTKLAFLAKEVINRTSQKFSDELVEVKV